MVKKLILLILCLSICMSSFVKNSEITVAQTEIKSDSKNAVREEFLDSLNDVYS